MPWRLLAAGACLWLVFHGLSQLLAGGDVIAGITAGSLLWGLGLLVLLVLRVFLVLLWPSWLLYRLACAALSGLSARISGPRLPETREADQQKPPEGTAKPAKAIGDP